MSNEQSIANMRTYVARLIEADAQTVLPAAYFQLGQNLLFNREFDEAEALMRRALEVSEQTGDISLESRCLTYLTLSARWRGQVALVEALAERSLRIALSEQMPDYICVALGNQCWVNMRQGDIAAARVLALRARQTWESTSVIVPMKWTTLMPLIQIALADGDVADAVEHARLMLDSTQQRLPAMLEQALETAITLADAGRSDAARAELEGVLPQARDYGYL